ncbi:MAG: threonine synthase [Woeseiaceae bacterium]
MMTYKSTRGGDAISLDDALLGGLAPDGGLYVPTKLPQFGIDDFDSCDDTPSIAARYLAPFFDGSALQDALAEIIAETFHFPLPLVDLSPELDAPLSVLELFHGPTAAFKDIGAGFLAACLVRLDRDVADERPLTILVATSGDTGGAVASAFHRREGVRVVVLFPEGKVSPRQQHQLTCWGDNVVSLAVRGVFDDCQQMVKTAFVDEALGTRFRFSSANSINIGRLLPQSVYYAIASLDYFRRHGRKLSFLVPTGNLGNGLAAVLARAAGLPIQDITLVSNENQTIPDFFATGDYQPRPSVATLASAMDVGAPSNLERLRHVFGERDDLTSMGLSASSVSDDEIEKQIAVDAKRLPFAWCPHTATAMYAWSQQGDAKRQTDQAIVATAHPAKFETIVEPIIGNTLPVPDALAELLALPSEFQTIDATVAALSEVLS